MKNAIDGQFSPFPGRIDSTKASHVLSYLVSKPASSSAKEPSLAT